MRVSLALLIAATFQLSAATGYAQRIRGAISMSKVSIEQVLNKIEESSDYVFLYNDKAIQKNRIVSVNNKSGKIHDILDEIFKGTSISYTVMDKQIILSAKPLSQNAEDDAVIPVKGVVRDAKGDPLIGVNVKVKGLSIGTITDVDGNFTIKTKKGSVLEFSYVGYTVRNVTITSDKPLTVVLQEDNAVLNEVVVTALGIKRSDKALSYNVQKLGSDKFTAVKEASVPNALNGKVAGVTISQGASGIGGSTKVVMRGSKSVNAEGNNNALYVLDGIPLPDLFPRRGATSNAQYGGVDEGDGISNINMEDIAEVTVLTGPSAAALYGGQAANGVIMLTSKQGGLKDGKPRVSFSHYSDFYQPLLLPKLQNSYGSRADEFSSWGPKLDAPANYDPADFFDTGMSFSNSIGAQLGNENHKSYVSLSSYNARGIVHNNDLDRYNISYNGTYAITDKLSLGTTFMYVNKKAQNMLSQGDYYNPIVPIYLFPRGDNIDKYKSYERYSADRGFPVQFWPYGDQKRSIQNPYWITHRNFNINHNERFIIGGSLKYTFNEAFNISARFRTDRDNKKNEIKNYASTLLLLASGSDKGSYLLPTEKNIKITVM